MREAAAGLLALALTLYALLGGADFGGGILDLTARGKTAERERAAIAHAIGPVWEANHVWLIFALTLGFSTLPRAFAAAMESLWAPFSLALLGIVFRGAAFAFRSSGAGAPGFRVAPQRIFGAASLLAPLGLGLAAGALAGGEIHLGDDGHARIAALGWLGPLPLTCAAMAACAATYLAAAYLAVECTRAGEPELANAFRRRGLAAAIGMSILAPLGLAAAHAFAPSVWIGLTGRGAPLVALSGLAGVASAAALATRRFRIARAFAAVAVATLLAGWIAAQWPLLVVPDLSIDASAAPEAALHATLLAAAVCGPILAASLALLFRTFTKPDQ